MNGHSCVPIKLDLQNRWWVWFGLRVEVCQPLIQRITCDSAKDSKVFVTELANKYYCHPHPFPYWHCSSAFGHMDCSPPGFSVHGISQTKVLEWVAISFSRGSSRPRDRTWVPCNVGRFFTDWATRRAIWIIRCCLINTSAPHLSAFTDLINFQKGHLLEFLQTPGCKYIQDFALKWPS